MAHLKGQERARYVTRMFARISRRYDLLNTVQTAGRHYAWRRMAAELAVGEPCRGVRLYAPTPLLGLPKGVAPSTGSGVALDVATGTGDFAIELARRPSVAHVVGLDFTPEMLALASQKAAQGGLGERLSLVAGDAHALPFGDNQFICATVGFGIRNFIDVRQALREMARVVMPGGRVVTLEIVRVEGRGPWARLFPLYFRYVTPWMGALLAGDREAYTYLPESVQGFLSAGELAAIMEEVGLRNVAFHPLALGTVAIHVGEKG